MPLAFQIALAQGSATGFVFDAAAPAALAEALQRAIGLFSRPERWTAVMQRAMAQDCSWHGSARLYMALYESLLPLR